MTLADHVSRHALSAIQCFEAFGCLTPKLWVASHRKIVIAEPNPGATVYEADRALLLAAMRDLVHGRYLGRCDEVWSTANPELQGMQLGPLSEHDPNVHTGLAIIGIDIKQQVAHGSILEPYLDDIGQQRWRVNALGHFAATKVLQAFIDAETLTPAVPLHELAHDLQWHYTIQTQKKKLI